MFKILEFDDPVFEFTLFEDLPTECEELEKLSAELGGLDGDASAFVECVGGGRKRATGRLRLAITLSRTPSRKCLKSSSCRRIQALILFSKARTVLSKARAGNLTINVTNTQTSEVTRVQLSGDLRPVSNRVQRTCAPGTVLDAFTCGEFRQFYVQTLAIVIVQ